MWPGMRPATGWMAYLILDAFLLEMVGHLAERVLRLRHRHAVARHDDDLRSVLQNVGGVLGRADLDRTLLAPPAPAATSPPKPPRMTEMKLRFMPLHMM
jgi:hypothetical protein